MSTPSITKTVTDFAKSNEVFKHFTTFRVLVYENDQIFVSFELPGRGAVAAWIKTPDNPRNMDYEVSDDYDEEVRDVAFLRNAIDDLDYNLNKAQKALAKEVTAAGASSAPSYTIPFMRLTIANSEDLRRRLSKELNDLF